ncbi:MAG TPA: sigma-54 dependent transcriptional regulator [Polyangiaceae bacterium]|nr:sigma-54 dependent transcriptional regulator [Polyangiaceae bacterium]
MRDCSNGDSDDRPLQPVSTVETTFRFGRAISRSAAMVTVLGTLNRLAPTELTITLVGETGTGKDVLSQAIHEHSARSSGPFVVFDCGAVAANLAESELFGHERGAFTGAQTPHAGAFERANGGTLFLDEIGELPLDLQPRLLRALENRGVRRVGGTQYRPVDLRVVAATNRDLPALAAEKLFRQDLFFRLAAVVVPIPSLRQRLDDIPLLLPSILNELGKPDLEVPEETYQHLRSHTWPGNVRELKNTIASALAFVDGPVLEPRHLRFMALQADAARLEQLSLGGQSLEALERMAIEQTLSAKGSKARAAQALGISLSTLYEKLKKFGL